MTLRDEIFQQADVLQNLLDTEWGHIQQLAQEIKARQINYIFLTARGTSDNAGLYLKYLFGINNGISVALSAPSMFSIYHAPPKLEGSMVLAISQSGQSPDIVEVVESGRKQGALTLTITNTADSPLANAADHVIDVQAGVEKAVAATKTYTAQLMSIAMLSLALNPDPEKLAVLRRTPEFVASILDQAAVMEEAVERYYYMKQCVIVGRGYNYATAFEWALKLEEMTYIVAKPYSSADFRHGPIAMVELGFPIFMVAPRGEVYPQLLDLAVELREQKKASLLILSNEEEILKHSSTPIRLPAEMPEWLSPIVSIVPGQLSAYYLAMMRGLDTENPRSLSKVTRTR